MNETTYQDAQTPQTAPTASFVTVDTDLLIDDLSYKDAYEYVVRFMTSEKQTSAELKTKEQEVNLWNERLAFAEKKGDLALANQAKQRLHFLIQEKMKMTADLEELHRKNIVLKEKLQLKAKTDGTPTTARSEQLLADLEQISGVEEYKINEAIKAQSVEDELGKLKSKLNQP